MEPFSVKKCSSILYVSGIKSNREHPSSHLANAYKADGAHVAELFIQSRNLVSLINDCLILCKILDPVKPSRIIANVNGSVSQLLILIVARAHNIPVDFWIMDLYPGCLLYTTYLWPILWLPFYLASLLVSTGANRLFCIDEFFIKKLTSSLTYKHLYLFRLPKSTLSPKTIALVASPCLKCIGIVGNIEQKWLDNAYGNFFNDVNSVGFDVLVATSSKINLDIVDQSGARLLFPWPKDATESVFSQITHLLVPLSSARCTYSSPSKIIDAYSRGIQPIIHCPLPSWKKNSWRLIYRHCIHYTDFLRCPHSFNPHELVAFSENWSSSYSDLVLRSTSDTVPVFLNE